MWVKVIEEGKLEHLIHLVENGEVSVEERVEDG